MYYIFTEGFVSELSLYLDLDLNFLKFFFVGFFDSRIRTLKYFNKQL
jgi:hypothetical protein